MLKRRIRTLTVTHITGIAMVAAALVTLSTTGATAATPAPAVVPAASATVSANAKPDTTLPTCYSPEASSYAWICVQVVGHGLYVTQWKGWAYDPPTGIFYPENRLHIELYYNAYGPYVPYNADSIPEENCSGFGLSPGENSDVCYWPGSSASKPVLQGYYCAALWYFADNSDVTWALQGSQCVYVLP